MPPPLSSPFASAVAVEDRVLRAIDVGGASPPPHRTAFLDGIQRYGVVGRIGVVPIVRGYAAAAVLERSDGVLSTALYHEEEFLVAPCARLADAALEAVAAAGLPLHDSTEGDRSHPILDVHLAGRVVERRREALERRLAEERLATRPQGWLIVDGAVAALPSLPAGANVLGVIKSHETQFLEGDDLYTALTLPVGCRTSVFARESGTRPLVYTWYLRLWPWEADELLHGLIRLERGASDRTLEEVTQVCRWLLAERAPLSAPDGRWDRLLYPVHQVEAYLRAQLGERW